MRLPLRKLKKTKFYALSEGEAPRFNGGADPYILVAYFKKRMVSITTIVFE